MSTAKKLTGENGSLRKGIGDNVKSKILEQMKTRFPLTASIIIVVVALASVYGVYRITSFEDSVLSIYADQQDAYVQVVLDQINLQKDKAEEEIINDILSSLDTSNEKYWTLSKDQALVFVKNVTETNRYKGFTTATYYISDSAKEFLESLVINQVEHKIIELEGEKLVASGVKFEYQEGEYKVCLLTSEDFILDQNVFLSAKISLYIYIGILLAVLFLVLLISAKILSDNYRQSLQEQERMQKLNETNQALERRLAFANSYHTRWNLYDESLFPVVIRKITGRKTAPVTMILLRFDTQKKRGEFLEQAQVLLDEKVMRFSSGDRGLILLFLKYEREQAQDAWKKVGDYSGREVRIGFSRHGGDVLRDTYKHFVAEEESRG